MGVVSIHLHIHQKGNNVESEDQDLAQGTPTPSENIKVFGEVSFSHTISPPTNGKSVGSFAGVVVNGRIDHGIGRVIPHTPGRCGSPIHHKRRF
jgi:hypothetical protein